MIKFSLLKKKDYTIPHQLIAYKVLTEVYLLSRQTSSHLMIHLPGYSCSSETMGNGYEVKGVTDDLLYSKKCTNCLITVILFTPHNKPMRLSLTRQEN